MANYSQLARKEQPGADYRCFNNSATEIPAKYCVLLETVSGYEHAVALPTNGGGSEKLFGVTVTAIPAAGWGTVRHFGEAVVVAHEAVAAGETVSCYDVTAHLGEVIKLVKTGNLEATKTLGECIVPADGDSQDCVVFINISRVTTDA